MKELVVIADPKKTKDRSPGFPFITLERALERVRQFYAEEKRGVAPYTRAVMHWKYSEASSGGLQTVAALKNYGLMIEPGGTGKARQLQLSELALRIHLDQRPDSPERLDYIRQAARAPNVAAEVYSKWPDELPSDSTLNHYLVLEKKFNEATATAVIRILKENQQFAKLNEGDVVSAKLVNEEDEVIEEAQKTGVIASPETGGLKLTGLAPKVVVSSTAPKAQGHTEQHVLRNGITVTIHMSAMPTANTYYALERLMKFKGDDYAAQEDDAPAPAQ